MDINSYISEIDRFKELAEGLPDDNPAALQKKIELLVNAMKLIGHVAAEYAWIYKSLHRKRKTDYALAYKAAASPKTLNAELAVEKIEEAENEAYALMHKYRNDFESTQEEIHALKQKMKVNFAEGSIGSRYEGVRG